MKLKTKFILGIAVALMLFLPVGVALAKGINKPLIKNIPNASQDAYIKVQELMYQRTGKIEEYLNRMASKIDDLELLDIELKNKAKEQINTHLEWLETQKQAIANAGNYEELKTAIQAMRRDWIKKSSIVHLYVSLLHLENTKRFLGRVEKHYELLVERLGADNENVKLVRQHLDEANKAFETAAAAILELDPQIDGDNMIVSGRELLKPVYEKLRLAIQTAKTALSELSAVSSENGGN